MIELASFNRLSEISVAFLDQLTENIGIMLNTIAATMRTEELLKDSQMMAEELKDQPEELRQTNEELEEKARELGQQKEEVESKNKEVEYAKITLEERAEQLALTSKYKSEFLTNMSHELRTPLNSLLILSNILSENRDGNQNEKQMQHAVNIYESGSKLLDLINEVLDLSKIESGTMAIDLTPVSFRELGDWAERSFLQLAREMGLDYKVKLAPQLPETMRTDEKKTAPGA